MEGKGQAVFSVLRYNRNEEGHMGVAYFKLDKQYQPLANLQQPRWAAMLPFIYLNPLRRFV